jgi:ferric enterobactin receptor
MKPINDNMRQIVAVLAVVIFAVNPVFSQTKGKMVPITGTIIDKASGDPLSYATISIFNAADGNLVTGGITDDSGKFKVEARPGTYDVVLDFISYKQQRISGIVVEKKSKNKDLGELGLELDAAVLAEVEVRAEQSEMQMMLDKKVFNVGQDLANAGGNASDLLDNVPSVAVDVEGNVTLRGSGGVRILINGRPSGIIGTDVAQGLRSIPADLIDRVEVITNPSARYEAEGAAGIINIILKKERKRGMNGSFQVNTGFPLAGGAGVNLNWRRNKFNYFTNLSVRYRESPGEGALFQELTRNDSLFISNQIRDRRREGWSGNFQIGADYSIDKKSTITTTFLYGLRDSRNFTQLDYEDYLFDLSRPIAFATRTDNEIEDRTNLEYALTYRKDFDKKGQELVFDLRFQDNNETEVSDLVEKFFDGEQNPSGQPDQIQRSRNEEGETQLIAQLDYVHPISKEGKFETGLRTSIRDIRTDFTVEEFDSDGNWNPLEGLTNEFLYDERIYAAYALLGDKLDRFSYQLGLRAEISDVTTTLVATDSVNARTYVNLFPSASVTYDLVNGHSLQVSYSRRLRRPRFRSLNPFFSFSDSRNFYSGNPNLDPEFTHSFELGHVKYWDKATISSAVFYRHTTGVIERIREVDDQGNSISRPENLSTQDSYGAEFTFSLRPLKWLKFSGDMNVFYAKTDGGRFGEEFNAEAFSGNGRLTTLITLWKELDTQWRFNYRAPRNTPQGKTKALTVLDIGISHPILKNKGTLTFSVRDAFNSRKWRWITEGPNFYNEGLFQWRARSFELTFSYRLNKSERRKQVRNKSSAEYRGGSEM